MSSIKGKASVLPQWMLRLEREKVHTRQITI
jgi:hypothetical protein